MRYNAQVHDSTLMAKALGVSETREDCQMLD